VQRKTPLTRKAASRSVRDPERDRIVELPGWFVMVSEATKNGRGSGRDLTLAEGLLDARDQVFDVPFGTARPKAAAL